MILPRPNRVFYDANDRGERPYASIVLFQLAKILTIFLKIMNITNQSEEKCNSERPRLSRITM